MTIETQTLSTEAHKFLDGLDGWIAKLAEARKYLTSDARQFSKAVAALDADPDNARAAKIVRLSMSSIAVEVGVYTWEIAAAMAFAQDQIDAVKAPG